MAVKVERIPLSEFDSVESLQGRLNDSQWPSDIPTNALGGIVNHTFPLPKLYRIALAVSGRTTQNGNEETFRLEKTVNVSTRPTLQVHLSSVKLRFHCRSDQLDRPDRPNSPTKLDQHCLVGLASDLFRTESADVWSSSDRVAVELIGYWSVEKCYPDHTRSLHDHFPINSIRVDREMIV